MNILYPLCAASFSGYYDFAHRLGRPEKDAALAEIIAEQREHSFHTYGYRRLWLVLKKRGIYRNPKTILRIMEKIRFACGYPAAQKMGQYGAAGT
ncbi:transposase [[Clostridium] leptum]|uniref:Transposase n=1 Tax=[Clostridium] leptum TaxID=1535 RepID=A0A412AWI9_9FIRM|nr:transposase [[Clostridium] leptum]